MKVILADTGEALNTDEKNADASVWYDLMLNPYRFLCMVQLKHS